jgi:chromosome partitioning protein
VGDARVLRRSEVRVTKLNKDYAFVLNQCTPGKSARTKDAYRFLSLGGSVAEVTLAAPIIWTR